MLRKIYKKFKSYQEYKKNKETLDLNLKLKNTTSIKRCFILGNGPSIKQQDLVILKNEETIVVNTFWNHPQYQEINPKYYFLIDPDIFPKQGEDWNYWSQETKEKSLIVGSYPTKLFLNIVAKEFIEKNNIYPNNEVFYIMIQGHFKDNLKYNIDIDKPIPIVKNVIISAIIGAIYMGFEEIYLLGCEHDYLAHPKYYEGFDHFYHIDKMDQNDPSQVEKYALDTLSYEGYIDQGKILFRNYRLLKNKLAREYPNVKIYNATPRSFLDVFPYKNYDEVIKTI